MSAIEQTYERIISYLKGLLSNSQRHDLEKEMMRDAFEEDAFDGLSRLSAEELESDMDTLLNRLDDRILPDKKRNLTILLRVAAAIIFMMGIGSVLYFVFRTPSQEFITQEIKKEEKTVPVETAKPETPKQVKGLTAPPVTEEKSEDVRRSKQETAVVKENIAEPVKAELAEKATGAAAVAAAAAAPAAEDRATEPDKTSEISRQKEAKALSRASAADQTLTGTISGKIVGVDGEALPGVTVLEKGTARGTLTDLDGRFSLQVGDTGAKLSLSYVGYKPLELDAKDISGSAITMQEDLLALEEVVVIGYGTREKRDVTGAVSRIEGEEISAGGGFAPDDFVKPVPPYGSLKAFKDWVYERINSEKFRAYPGKHRLQVILMIQTNGSVRDITVKSNAPAAIATEFRNVISQSPPWKPAITDNNPVESQVIIRFNITVE